MLAIWLLARQRGTPARPLQFPTDVNWEVRRRPGWRGRRMDIVTGGANPKLYEVKIFTGPATTKNVNDQLSDYRGTYFKDLKLGNGNELGLQHPVPYVGPGNQPWVMWAGPPGHIYAAPVSRARKYVRVEKPAPLPETIPSGVPVTTAQPQPITVPDDHARPVLPDWRAGLATAGIPVVVAGAVAAPAVTIPALAGGATVAATS